ncbi:MAG: endonuclease/exonuclease/phosphatase family protein [Polyangiales bacterium]
MARSFVFYGVCTLLMSCSDGNQPREPQEVTLDTFNTALAGAFIPYEAERRQPIAEAMAATDADIICLQEVWNQADKELIRDAAIQTYPYSAFFRDNLDTPIDDATDQQGQVPPPPTGAPCPDEVAVGNGLNVLEQMNAAVDCVRDNCSTLPDPSSDLGRTTSTECASSNCVGAVAGLLFGDAQQQRCYACLVTQLPTSTFAKIRDSCANVVNQDLAFDGQNGVMILSRHPLKNAAEWVLPGTWNRRVIVSATAELPNGSDVDIYCNHFTSILQSAPINTYPYTGQYGDGMTGPAGWLAEMELQAQKLINYVNQTSGSRQAVILGDFNSGHAYPAESIAAEAEPTLNILESAFSPAYTASYTPLCTYCSANPVTNPNADPNVASVWIDQILLDNFASDSVLSTARIFDQDVVPAGGMMVPLSDHYGMRSVISVP